MGRTFIVKEAVGAGSQTRSKFIRGNGGGWFHLFRTVRWWHAALFVPASYCLSAPWSNLN